MFVNTSLEIHSLYQDLLQNIQAGLGRGENTGCGNKQSKSWAFKMIIDKCKSVVTARLAKNQVNTPSCFSFWVDRGRPAGSDKLCAVLDGLNSEFILDKLTGTNAQK